jgi:hypothetical protein
LNTGMIQKLQVHVWHMRNAVMRFVNVRHSQIVGVLWLAARNSSTLLRNLIIRSAAADCATVICLLTTNEMIRTTAFMSHSVLKVSPNAKGLLANFVPSEPPAST